MYALNPTALPRVRRVELVRAAWRLVCDVKRVLTACLPRACRGNAEWNVSEMFGAATNDPVSIGIIFVFACAKARESPAQAHQRHCVAHSHTRTRARTHARTH